MMYFVYIWFTVFNYLIETEQGNEHQYKKKHSMLTCRTMDANSHP